ncbi:hypothetical protein [Spirochaeta cellobiosiphila]|uniref:hypothetical protein n=1 Tax=Spirochaeta cellobiosiphila TaxID=504483 RepID=UPI000412A675|nr:hypothetical protein [Spirochaeta cellobiosiphila]
MLVDLTNEEVDVLLQYIDFTKTLDDDPFFQKIFINDPTFPDKTITVKEKLDRLICKEQNTAVYSNDIRNLNDGLQWLDKAVRTINYGECGIKLTLKRGKISLIDPFYKPRFLPNEA